MDEQTLKGRLKQALLKNAALEVGLHGDSLDATIRRVARGYSVNDAGELQAGAVLESIYRGDVQRHLLDTWRQDVPQPIRDAYPLRVDGGTRPSSTPPPLFPAPPAPPSSGSVTISARDAADHRTYVAARDRAAQLGQRLEIVD